MLRPLLGASAVAALVAIAASFGATLVDAGRVAVTLAEQPAASFGGGLGGMTAAAAGASLLMIPVTLFLPMTLVFVILQLPGAAAEGAITAIVEDNRTWRQWRWLWTGFLFAAVSAAFFLVAPLGNIVPVSKLELPLAAVVLAALSGGMVYGLLRGRR